ncbi:MAG: DUF3817 domain-containing protein [Bacteroidota bacterium]
MKLITTSQGRLRLVGLAEGISLLILIGIAMPLKYAFGMPEATKAIGMLHGLLFVLYVLLIIMMHIEMSWKFGRTAMLLAASVIPFGTIYADRKVFKQL